MTLLKLLVSTCLLMFSVCLHAANMQESCSSPTTLKGQLNLELKKHSRAEVSYKAPFRGQAGQGSLTLCTDQDVLTTIILNQEVLKKNVKLSANQPLAIDISKHVATGVNYLHLDMPDNTEAKIHGQVPYPELRLSTDNHYDFKAVDQLIEADIKQGFPGAVLAVVKDGKLVKHQAYGYAKRYSKTGEPLGNPEPVTLDTLFDLASNTKMYATNFALMKLASEGKLDVHQPIANYIAEYKGEGRESRLVKDLLYHTAGYPPSTAFYNRAQTGASGLYSQDPQKTRQLLTTRVPFRDPRGKKVVYSDNDYLLLGVLVERLVGMPLDKYVEESIYKPLGITKVMFNPLQKGIPVEDTAATELAGNSRDGRVSFENIRTDVIRGEVHDEKAYYSMAGVAGHAGLFGTAKEIARLALILLNQGGAGELQLFSPDVLDQFFKPSALNPTMALGWRRAGHGDRSWQFGPYASPNAVGHTGWTGTVTIIDPAQELIIVLLTNRKHSPIIEQDGALTFIGDTFETGKYGSVITLIYEALLKGQDD